MQSNSDKVTKQIFQFGLLFGTTFINHKETQSFTFCADSRFHTIPSAKTKHPKKCFSCKKCMQKAKKHPKNLKTEEEHILLLNKTVMVCQLNRVD